MLRRAGGADPTLLGRASSAALPTPAAGNPPPGIQPPGLSPGGEGGSEKAKHRKEKNWTPGCAGKLLPGSALGGAGPGPGERGARGGRERPGAGGSGRGGGLGGRRARPAGGAGAAPGGTRTAARPPGPAGDRGPGLEPERIAGGAAGRRRAGPGEVCRNMAEEPGARRSAARRRPEPREL